MTWPALAAAFAAALTAWPLIAHHDRQTRARRRAARANQNHQ